MPPLLQERRASTPTMRGMAVSPQQKLQGDIADFGPLVSPASSSSERPAGADRVTPPARNLKERRGLKLSVDTAKKSRELGHTNPVSPVKEEPPEICGDERPAHGEAPECERSSSKPPSCTTPVDDALPPEPMSALLRRRQEDWNTGMVCATNSKKVAGLTVGGSKVFSVHDDQDCPQSPKRIRKKSEEQYA